MVKRKLAVENGDVESIEKSYQKLTVFMNFESGIKFADPGHGFAFEQNLDWQQIFRLRKILGDIDNADGPRFRMGGLGSVPNNLPIFDPFKDAGQMACGCAAPR